MSNAVRLNRLVCFGVFELDTHSGELRKQGVRIKLQDQPLQLLQVLLEKAGEVVTREELQKRIWPADTFVDFDKGLYNAVKKLREALGDVAGAPRYIETVPKRGYRFIFELKCESPGPTLVMPTPPVQADDRIHKRSFVLSGITALALAFGLAMIWYLVRQERKTLTERDTIVLADFANSTDESVFDDALKQGLAVDLQQSPFMNILSDERVSEQLRYMGRSEETRLTPDVAKEVCRRALSKAVLIGSISRLGSHYVIAMKAMDCRDSVVLDQEQSEADQRESVLMQLHALARHLRSKLGESLGSLQKYDTPLEQATTTSLEALQAYSLATRTFRSQGDAAALPLYKRAAEIDPGFALAYTDLSAVYANLKEYSLSMESARKAYRLRSKVSDWERFAIDSEYYNVTGELEKEVEVLDAWRKIYPHFLAPYVNLGFVDSSLGRLEKALQDDAEGMRLNPDTARFYSNLADDYMSLNRLNEAAATLEEAKKRNLGEPVLTESYQLAFLRGNDNEMSRCLNDGLGKPGVEDALLASQSDTEAFHGRLNKARELSQRAVDSALRSGSKEAAAAWRVDAALREAEFGNLAQARHEAEAAYKLASTKEIRIAIAMVFARSGEINRAQLIVTDLAKSFPDDTLLNKYWLPSIRAAIAINQRRMDQAIEYLQTTAPYELGGVTPPFSSGATLYPAYLRGLAYSGGQHWREAAVEFQKIVDHRGLIWNFPIGVLARLQLARAYARAGHTSEARNLYKDFLSLFQDSDPGLMTLHVANSEYAAIDSPQPGTPEAERVRLSN